MPKSKRKAPGFSHDSEVLQGMSRGVWASHWSNEQEEKGRSFSGRNIYEIAPKTPAWAVKWAKKLAGTIHDLNGLTIDELFEMAQASGFDKDREAFGFYLGMQAVGSGIHWTDDIPHLDTPKILVPDYQFYPGAEKSDPDIRFVK